MTKHVWLTYEDTEGPGDNNEAIDIFAGVNHGYCNGPKCKVCGFTACHHCHPEIYEQECP